MTIPLPVLCFSLALFSRSTALLGVFLLSIVPRLACASDRLPGHDDPAARASLVSLVESTTVTPASLTITPAAPAVCAGASASLSLAGCPAGGSIRWSTGQTGASITVRPAQTTTYSATCAVTGPQAGTATVSAVVTVAQAATITEGPSSASVCEGATVRFIVSLVSSTPATYAWYRNGVALTVPTFDNRQLTLTSVNPTTHNGDYTIVITNQCGSVTSSAARLTVSPALSLTSTVTPATCAGTSTGQVFIAATGGIGERQFQLNNGAFQPSNIFTSLGAGTYPIVVKDALGCTAQRSAEVRQPASLGLTFRSVAAKCSGGADGGLIVAASGGNGGYRYQLNGGQPQTGDTFFDLKANTTYTVTATDRLGCATSQSVLIGAPSAFDIKPTVMAARCSGSADGSINVSVTGGTGGYQYQIGTGAFQTGTLFTGLSANTYEITVRDANGCLGKQNIAVQQPTLLRLTATATPTNCFGANSGSITVTPGGGTGTLQYQLTTSRTPQSSNVFQKMAIGEYTVVATDRNGCTAIATATVGKADPLDLRAAAVPATCCVCPTGGVILASSGGSGTGRSFQLVDRPFQAGNQFGGLRPGTYRFRVGDEAGCLDTVAAVIVDASAMTLTAGRVKDIACAGGRDGEAAVQLTGGTKPFTFYWQTERRDTLRARTQTQTGLPEGTYTVSVLDSNRCTTSTAFVTVRTLSPLPPQPIVAQTSGVLSVTEITGIQWYVKGDTGVARPVPNANQPTLTPFQSGQYYVVVTANGCASLPSNVINFVLTALPEPLSSLSIRVVPNPVTDRLRLELEQPDRRTVQIRLFDASGRAVLQHRIPPFVGKLQADWPLSGLPAGTYLLRAEAGERRAVIRVLVE